MIKFILAFIAIIIVHPELSARYNFNQDNKDSVSIEWFLKAEGINDSAKIGSCLSTYHSLLTQIKNEIDSADNNFNRCKSLFKYVHKKYLIKYDENARVSDTFEKKYYNCLTASVLYYYLCRDINIPLDIYATPFHVFLKLKYKNDLVKIDLTDPKDGFNDNEDRIERINSLLEEKYITKEEISRRGIDSIYADYYLNEKEISATNLLQLSISNIALDYWVKSNYNRAFDLINKAMKIDPDFDHIQKKFYLIWTSSYSDYQETSNLEKMASLISCGLDYPRVSNAFKKDLLLSFSRLMDKYAEKDIQDKKIDILLNRCRQNCPDDSFKELLDAISAKISVVKVIGLTRRGEYDKALAEIKPLYKKNGLKDTRVEDLYMFITEASIQYFMNHENYRAALSLADTLLNDFSDYQLVQEFYMHSASECIFKGELYLKSPEFIDRMIKKAGQIAIEGEKGQMAAAIFYHEYSMSMVRKNDYPKAKEYVLAGLKIAPNDDSLQKDLKMIEPLLSYKVNSTKQVRKIK